MTGQDRGPLRFDAADPDAQLPLLTPASTADEHRRAMSIAILLLFLAPQATLAGAAPATVPVESPAADQESALVDAEIEPWRRELLMLAFDAVSAFPLEPHIKNRSRAQEQVAETALELGQLALVAEFAGDIANWRRGAVEAALALQLIEAGYPAPAEPLLVRAAEAAAAAGEDVAQGWRRDRILARIALAQSKLGRTVDPSLEIEASEQGGLRADRMRHASPEQIEVELQILQQAVEIDDFEGTKAAIQAYVVLHDRFYDNAAQRERFEGLNRAAWQGIPIPLAVQAELSMAETAVRHGDAVDARRLIDGAMEHVAGSRWAPEHRVPVEARLAALNHSAGRADEARAQANAAFAMFDENAEQIISIYRAEALIPLAEAFMVLETPATAGALYLRALEEAWINPNSRPRAEDFAAICCSMAKVGHEPGEDLVERMATARGELGDPW